MQAVCMDIGQPRLGLDWDSDSSNGTQGRDCLRFNIMPRPHRHIQSPCLPRSASRLGSPHVTLLVTPPHTQPGIWAARSHVERTSQRTRAHANKTLAAACCRDASARAVCSQSHLRVRCWAGSQRSSGSLFSCADHTKVPHGHS